MHTRKSRAAWAGAAALIGALVLLAPTQTLAEQSSQAPRNGWGWGFNVQLWHYDTVARSNVIGDVTQAGFNWITQQVEWVAVETAPGTYDWTQLDNIVGDSSAAGLNVILSFSHAPLFYRTPTTGLRPADPSTF